MEGCVRHIRLWNVPTAEGTDGGKYRQHIYIYIYTVRLVDIDREEVGLQYCVWYLFMCVSLTGESHEGVSWCIELGNVCLHAPPPHEALLACAPCLGKAQARAIGLPLVPVDANVVVGLQDRQTIGQR